MIVVGTSTRLVYECNIVFYSAESGKTCAGMASKTLLHRLFRRGSFVRIPWSARITYHESGRNVRKCIPARIRELSASRTRFEAEQVFFV